MHRVEEQMCTERQMRRMGRKRESRQRERHQSSSSGRKSIIGADDQNLIQLKRERTRETLKRKTSRKGQTIT